MIRQERETWEREKDDIKQFCNAQGEVVNLNIGGTTHLSTEKKILQSVKDSILAKLFSDLHELKKIDDEVFLDRDGKTFETLINYLRNDRRVFPDFTSKQDENMFFKELHYWGIDKEHRAW
jgi:hypothetical protein